MSEVRPDTGKGESTAIQRQNLEIARRLVEIYESEGPWAVEEHFDEFFHPEMDWRPAVAELGDRTYVGREGYRAWQKDIEAATGELTQFDFEVRSVGDRVVLVLCRIRMVGKESGAELESEYGAVYEMEDGRGVAGRAFLSHGEATRFAEQLGGTAA